MKLIRVHLRQKGYDIVVGNRVLRSLGTFLKRSGCRDNAVIVTNPVIKRIWGQKISAFLNKSGINVKFEVIPDTERSKSIETAFELLNRISRLGKSRSISIIACGGGVVGDLSGFIASIYKRGIPYIQLPTTLLAQVDSAIGGKAAIDLKTGKNLVGSFYQPKLVFSETAFLETLPKKEISNGLAEVIKCAVIKDLRLFEFLETNLEKIKRLDKNSLEHIISAACKIKARVVERDEFDNRGIRAILNYGHTIGHAIETASGYSKRYTHGEAISAGMAAANFIAMELGLLSQSQSKRIEGLLEKAGLPIKATGVIAKRVYDAHLYDKKFINGKNRFVLPVSIGAVKIVEAVPEGLIKKAISAICQ